jgi:GNAT superfamily N-acetyltransferase
MSYSDVAAGQIAAVVTSLEMLARPSPRPTPANPLLTLRHVERPGLDWFRALFRSVGEDWLWFSRLAMSDAALAAIIHDRDIEVHVLMSGSDEAGLLELDFRHTDECEVSFFGLTPRFIGAGAGRWLMNQALERAWSRPLRRLWIHTCTFDHPSALAFYMRTGFRPYRRQIEIVQDPRLTGLAPRTAAPHVPVIEQAGGSS